MQGHAAIRRIAWALILISLLAASPVLFNRYIRERDNERVDLVVDLPAMRILALQDGRPLVDLLADAAKAGVTSVAINEMNAKELAEHGLALVRTGAELRAQVILNGAPNPFLARLIADPSFDEAYTYLLPVDTPTALRIWRDVQWRHDPNRIAFVQPQPGEPGAGAIALEYRDNQLSQYGVGFDPKDFALANQAGLRPIPRPRPAPGATPASIAAIFDEIQRQSPAVKSVMFQGNEILGYRADGTDGLAQTAAEIKQRGWVLNLVEHSSQLAYVDQKGYQYLADALDYRIARVFSMGQDWQDKVQPYEAVDMWWRAVLERNIRTIYLRPFLAKQDPGLTASETTMRYFARSVDELQARGYATGVPDTFTPYYVPFYLKVLIGLGVVGAAILWLSYTWPFRASLLAALMGVGIVGEVGMLYVMPNTGLAVLGIAIATFFPTLAATWLMLRWGLGSVERRAEVAIPSEPKAGWVVKEAAVVASTFFAINLTAGLLIASAMGDVKHMLEFEFFRGVKLVFLAPLALALLTYLLLGRKGSPLAVARSLVHDGLELLKVTVKYRDLILLGILGVVGLYYIQRSGNFPSVPVSQLELDMRTMLERLLLARPRTKEFIIAYPSLVVSAAFLATKLRRYIPILLIAVMTGAVSTINSFQHLRTPWAISLLRGINGLWLGFLLGLVALVGLVILRAILVRIIPDEKSRG